MKHLNHLLLSAILLCCITKFSVGQNNYLISAPALKTLGTNQQLVLSNITSEATTARNQIVQVNLNALKSYPINVQLFDGETLTVTEERTSEQAAGFIWVGKNQSNTGRIILVSSGNNIVGSISVGTKIYGIRTLGEGTQAMIEINQNNYPNELCFKTDTASTQQNQSQNNQVGTNQTFSISSPGGFECNLRLLVAYTSSAASAAVSSGFGNIQSLILLAVEETNQSYINSNINHKVELAHIAAVSYTEGDFETDLNNFAGGSDGNMDEIYGLRNLYSADVCVFVVNNSTYCGLAKTIYTDNNPSQAFCEVHYNCATGNYSFAHEIGHLQGARHDPYVDNSTSPFASGHGYVKVSGLWRTIMAYNNECTASGVSCTRLQYWSNPNINSPVDGTPMGTTATHYNAAVLNGSTGKMKNYRVPSNDVYLDNITISGLGYADVIAKNTINVSNYTTQPGSIVRLRSGQSITIEPNTTIEGDFEATNEPVIDCCTNDIIPVVPNNATIPFQVCSGGGSQLCLGFNCATSYSFTIYNTLGQLIHQASGSISDNVACIWNGSGAASGYYYASVTASNGNQSISLSYTIFVFTASCKMAASNSSSNDSTNTTLSKSVSDLEQKENEFTLILYPNPVNHNATIEYSLPSATTVSLKVTNAFGQEIIKILDNKKLASGKYKANIDATFLSAGIYYYTLQTSEKQETKKFILIK